MRAAPLDHCTQTPSAEKVLVPLPTRACCRVVIRCLFPPFTMLSVLEPETTRLSHPDLSSVSGSRAVRAEDLAESCNQGEKSFLRIRVRPSFV